MRQKLVNLNQDCLIGNLYLINVLFSVHSVIGPVVPGGQPTVYTTATSPPQQTHPQQNIVPSQQSVPMPQTMNGIPTQSQYVQQMGSVTNMVPSDFNQQNMPGHSVYQQPISQQQLL